MNEKRAVARLQFVFPGAEVQDGPRVDTTPVGAGVTVTADGRLFLDRCRCPRHVGTPAQTSGHEAKPIARPDRRTA